MEMRALTKGPEEHRVLATITISYIPSSVIPFGTCVLARPGVLFRGWEGGVTIAIMGSQSITAVLVWSTHSPVQRNQVLTCLSVGLCQMLPEGWV